MANDFVEQITKLNNTFCTPLSVSPFWGEAKLRTTLLFTNILTMLHPHIFRAYDIRGIYQKDLNEETARLIGKGYGTYLIRNAEKHTSACHAEPVEARHTPKETLRQAQDDNVTLEVVVGRDNRTHGESLQNALIEGLRSTGINVTNVGLSTSPLLYFSICQGNFDGGINVTASHNPKEFNGFKLQEKMAHSICGDKIQEILQLIQNKDFEIGKGDLKEDNFFDEYTKKISRIVEIKDNPKIIVDAGNGISGKFAPELFEKLGCKVIPLFCELDGTFPNHQPDPEVEENLVDLKKKVLDEKADFGIAFDGDGDRTGIVDSEGNHYPADLLILLLARDILKRHPKTSVVYDLKATEILKEEILKFNGKPVMSPTGHSFVEELMTETGALLGGELSGHIFIAENYYGFDDAFLAAAKILEIITKSNKPLKEHFADLPETYNTPEIKLGCAEDKKFTVVDKITAHFVDKYECLTIDGVRIDFGNGAWGICRASNTSPKLTLRFEAKSQEKLEEIKKEVLEYLRGYEEIQF